MSNVGNEPPDEGAGLPLTPALSPWEREARRDSSSARPLSHGEREPGEGRDVSEDVAEAIAGWLTYLGRNAATQTTLSKPMSAMRANS